jgi:hypothetical protein
MARRGVPGAGAAIGAVQRADRLLHRGHLRARVIVPAVCLLALTPVLAPALATSSVAVALPLLMVGAFLLGAPNPPLDAARLDIMPPRLWGRAEGVRTALRSAGEATAPLVFGYVSQYVSAALSTPSCSSSSRCSSPACSPWPDCAPIRATWPPPPRPVGPSATAWPAATAREAARRRKPTPPHGAH